MSGEPVVLRAYGNEFPLRPARRWEAALYLTVRAMILAVAKLFFRIRIEGTEHIPARGEFVLAPVHRSNIDFAVVSLLTRRRMRYIAKDSLFKNGPLGRFFLALGSFPVHRGSADRAALRTCIEVIEGGEPLVLFPEGTRQHGPVVEEVFDGAAYVASRTGVPIVPVAIGGSERAMPKGARMLRPVKLTMVVGPPIPAPTPPEGSSRVPRSAIAATTAEVKAEIQRLFDDAQRLAGTPNRP